MNDSKPNLYFYIICTAIIVGLSIYSLISTKNIPKGFHNKEISCEATIIKEPDIRDLFMYIVIETNNPNATNENAKSKTNCDKLKIRAKVDLYPEHSYKDEVLFEGKVSLPESFETDTGRIFNYQEFLLKDDIVLVSHYPEITKISEGNPLGPTLLLFKLKKKFVSQVNRLFPSPHAELLNGLLVGEKQSLGEKLLRDFQKVGLIHIVVLSGFNVVIIIKFVMFCLSGVSRTVSISLTAIFIILFAIMVGLHPPIVRASIMALIALLGMTTYQNYNVHRAFFIAIVIMAIENPMIILFDPSFELSALATAGLLYVGPIINEKASFISERFGLRETVVATVSTYISVLPFIIYLTGELSAVSLIVNLLVLPIIPLTMLSGLLAVVFSQIFLLNFILGFIFKFLTYLMLSYELLIVKYFASLPFATFTIPKIESYYIWLMYFVMAIWIFWKFRKRLKSSAQ